MSRAPAASKAAALKEHASGCAGCYTALHALELYAAAFDAAGALDKLEAFASINGATHYKMPVNTDTITLEKISWVAPEEVKVEGPDERAIIYRGGETIEWKVTAN